MPEDYKYCTCLFSHFSLLLPVKVECVMCVLPRDVMLAGISQEERAEGQQRVRQANDDQYEEREREKEEGKNKKEDDRRRRTKKKTKEQE